MFLRRCEKVDLNDIVTELVSLLPVTSVTSNMTYYNSYCFWCSSDPGPGLIWSLNISCSQWLALQSSRSEQDLIVTAMKSPFCWIRLQVKKNLVLHLRTLTLFHT